MSWTCPKMSKQLIYWTNGNLAASLRIALDVSMRPRFSPFEPNMKRDCSRQTQGHTPHAPLTNLSFRAQLRQYTNLFIDVELISSSIYRRRANYFLVLSFTVVDTNSLNLTTYFQRKWCFWVFLQYIFPSKACYAGNGLDFLGNLYTVGRRSTGCPAICITSGLWYRYACWFSHATMYQPYVRWLQHRLAKMYPVRVDTQNSSFIRRIGKM